MTTSFDRAFSRALRAPEPAPQLQVAELAIAVVCGETSEHPGLRIMRNNGNIESQKRGSVPGGSREGVL